jgi:macrolide transport system ATP-binding/permease protein
VTTTPLVRCAAAARTFGAGRAAVVALHGATCEIGPGERIAIVGPSGSGKSTLLNIVGCLDEHTTGSYRFDGVEVSELTDRQRAGLRCRKIGFVFQSFHLLAHRSVTENVMLADVYRRAPVRDRRSRALSALDRVGLVHRAEFLPTRLSGGERQRVAIARALSGSPRLLLCDEPTGNLDSASTANVLELLGQLNATGVTIVVITHDQNVAGRAGRETRMTDGRLVEVGR